MSKVVLDVTMSLDGFTTGPNVREAEPMGDGGERLHEWMAGNGPHAQIDIGVRREVDANVGAAVIGRRTFDLGVGPWGGTPWKGIPTFVVTHRARQDLLGKNGGTFVFDGLEAAVRRAKQAAGHKNVMVLGANVARQLLRAGLLDEVRIHPRSAPAGRWNTTVRRGAVRADSRREAAHGDRDSPALPCRHSLGGSAHRQRREEALSILPVLVRRICRTQTGGGHD